MEVFDIKFPKLKLLGNLIIGNINEYIAEELKESVRCLLVINNETKLYMISNNKRINIDNLIEKFSYLKCKTTDKLLILDGEIIAESIEEVFAIIYSSEENAIEKDKNYHFIVNDCLCVNGTEITKLPLYKRKNILKLVVDKLNNNFIKCSEYTKQIKQFYNEAEKNNKKGIVYKHIHSLFSKNTVFYYKICVRYAKVIIVDFKVNQYSVLKYGINDSFGNIIEYGSIHLNNEAAKENIVIFTEEDKLKYIGKVIEIRYNYLTKHKKFKNAKFNKFCLNEDINNCVKINDLFGGKQL